MIYFKQSGKWSQKVFILLGNKNEINILVYDHKKIL